MDYEKLKAEVKEIAAISQQVPEPLRGKCFEILLTHFLGAKPKENEAGIEDTPSRKKPASVGALSLPASVKAFMKRTEVTQEQIESMVMVDDNEFHFIKEPTHTKVSKGQMEWALLLALRNGILNNSLSVDPEAVRSIVQEKGFYDPANFAANFKTEKNSALFKGTMEQQGPARALSTKGEKELAELIKHLTK